MGKKSRSKKERREQRERAQQEGTPQAKAQREEIQPGAISGEYPEEQDMVMETAGESDSDEQEERIFKILGVSEDDADVNWENLNIYFEYLEKNLKIPCLLTGIEDMGCFGWEEYYTFGPGNEREYEKLKKKYPSYTDDYELLSFSDEIDEEKGIFVHVKRTSDKKKFTLPLADLEGVGEKPKIDQLINDYVVWFVNYRY